MTVIKTLVAALCQLLLDRAGPSGTLADGSSYSSTPLSINSTSRVMYPFEAVYQNDASLMITEICFSKVLGGFVDFFRPIGGQLPREDYGCGYFAKQEPPRVLITLHDSCKLLVEESNGYYDMALLTGIIIDDNYKRLKIPRAGKRYDEYPLHS